MLFRSSDDLTAVLKQRLSWKQRRLNILELQIDQLGGGRSARVDPSMLIEVEELKKEIKQIENKLDSTPVSS